MQQAFLVESRSYDRAIRGSWKGFRLAAGLRLGDEQQIEDLSQEGVRVWLPAGTTMNWATGARPLRNNCLQIYWPDRWYMLSAFYNDLTLIHTYAIITQPPHIEPDRLSYVDLNLSMLVKPDLSYEVLTQAEFEEVARLVHYSEETRISALMSLQTLTSSIQRSVGLFSLVPHHLDSASMHLVEC